jgi:hypothetical protein
MPAFVNWRTLLTIVALIIVTGTIFYSNYLANKIAADERQIVEAWAEAHRYIASAGPEDNITFASVMISSQQTIPVIETTENDSITNFHNIDSADIKESKDFCRKSDYALNGPIITYLRMISPSSISITMESCLLKEVRYYPLCSFYCCPIHTGHPECYKCQAQGDAEPVMGWPGQRNCPSTWYSCFSFAWLGRNVEGNRYGPGDG